VTEVLQVVHFRKLLEREPAQDAELSYLCFGAPTRFTLNAMKTGVSPRITLAV
jgi:hypothetical protein